MSIYSGWPRCLQLSLQGQHVCFKALKGQARLLSRPGMLPAGTNKNNCMVKDHMLPICCITLRQSMYNCKIS
jgi:hypothetical protein